MIPIGETADGRADMSNFEMDLLDTRVHNYPSSNKDPKEGCCQNSMVKPACIPITIVAILLMITFLMPIFNDDLELGLKFEKTGFCVEECGLEIVESIPTGLTFDHGPKSTSTDEAWLELIKSAEKSIRIASFYWTLRSSDYPTAIKGKQIFDALVDAGQRGVKISIVQNKPSKAFPQEDSAELANRNLADVKSIDFPKLLGSGVLHTKFIIVDEKNIYIGSANMDWRSLSEVKELGVVIRNCSCMAIDLQKIFVVYWRIADSGALIPEPWPLNLRTKFNHEHPLNISYNGQPMQSFISSSPQEFNAKGRDHDLEAIEWVIGQAKEYVRVGVMDYFPATLYMGAEKNYYWGKLDSALRAAAFRGVRVDLMISHWNYSRPEMLGYLRSMLAINPVLPLHKGRRGQINVKQFMVPSSEEQKRIDHGRVNHNKYMVTDKAAYIGTSNWAADYFISTAGVGIILQQVDNPTIVSQFNDVFERDWTSKYAESLV